MNRREFVGLGLSAVAGATWLRPARAEDAYPSRPVRLVVPFSAGGLVDVVARKWADQMRKHLGSVYIDNQGGAGGTLGAAQVAKASPDGYTLLMGNTSTQILNPLSMPKISYNAQTSFQPVSMLCIATPGILVNPKVPANSLKELVALIKAAPTKMSYGSAGAGTITNLTGEMFKRFANVPDVVHIPYKGVGAGLSDIVSGHIPMMVAQLNDQILALHREKQVRILAVTSAERLEGAPDLPTAVESGLPDLVSQVFNAILAPAGTPPAVVNRIARATQAALAEREFRDHLITAALQPMKETDPPQADAYIRREYARFAPILKELQFGAS